MTNNYIERNTYNYVTDSGEGGSLVRKECGREHVSVVTQMQICIFPVLSKAGQPIGASISRGLGLLPCG